MILNIDYEYIFFEKVIGELYRIWEYEIFYKSEIYIKSFFFYKCIFKFKNKY